MKGFLQYFVLLSVSFRKRRVKWGLWIQFSGRECFPITTPPTHTHQDPGFQPQYHTNLGTHLYTEGQKLVTVGTFSREKQETYYTNFCFSLNMENLLTEGFWKENQGCKILLPPGLSSLKVLTYHLSSLHH